MQYSVLPRDAGRVYETMARQDDGSFIATKPFTIVFPKRFLERDMAYIGDTVRCIGVFMMAAEGYRSLFSVCAFVELEPDSIAYFNYQGIDYTELKFDPGSRIFKTTEIVQRDIVVYRIYKEFLSSGNIPFYLEQNEERDDPAALLDTAKQYAGTNIGSQRPVTELIASLSSRDPNELIRFFRQLPPEEQARTRPNFIGLMSAAYGAVNTLSRLAGAGYDQGLSAALVYPTDQISEQEQVIRS